MRKPNATARFADQFQRHWAPFILRTDALSNSGKLCRETHQQWESACKIGEWIATPTIFELVVVPNRRYV